MMCLSATDLSRLRDMVATVTADAGLHPDRVARLTLAVNEVATNAIQHGGGAAEITVRVVEASIVVDVDDDGAGIPADVGAVRPRPDAMRGRGLWLANHLCDEVEVVTGPSGTRVRLVMGLG